MVVEFLLTMQFRSDHRIHHCERWGNPSTLSTTTTTSDLFTKTYADLSYRFPTMVRHNGVVLAFAMDSNRRIYYTVLDFGPGGSMSLLDADHWSPNPQPLTFASRAWRMGLACADAPLRSRPYPRIP